MRALARGDLAPTLLGFFVLWLLLDRSAAGFGSMRGEFGLIVCALVLVAAVACECILSRRSVAEAVPALGLRWTNWRALLWALALSAALLPYFPIFAATTGARLELLPGAAWLALGMFAQGGIAEEVVFRGFVFRRLRATRPFWHAALLAAAPFVVVHALLLLQLDFAVALASLLLAVSISFPLAWLFERSGGSVLAPALVHGVVQAGIKVLDAGDRFPLLALGWIALCATVPWLLFLLPERKSPSESVGGPV
ncbi:MAG TPA: CPBP family intramembrane glutamic endopeptidase [Hyphomicrobiaceae bacterium]|nr:CPBP family intramembrane glutamic endopeptidase [Hyphomicrobiaceae bacterium]